MDAAVEIDWGAFYGQMFSIWWMMLKVLGPYLLPFFAVAIGLRLFENWLVKKRNQRAAHAAAVRRVSSTPTKTVADDLEKLAALRELGALSHAEWIAAKELTISGASPHAFDSIERLHKLWKSGAISESEFNSKKWMLLSAQS